MRFGSRRVLAGVVVAACAVVAAVVARPAFAATITISGYAYRDLDNDGVRDASEPGVPGIKVRLGSGSISTVTAADSSYTLNNLPTSGNMTVETGWLRSQCPDASKPGALNCPAGPGPDNDFTVNNQFLLYPLAGTHSASNIDVGLLPDWPGDDLLPPAAPVPGNPVDVAARLSWVNDTCAGGSMNICRAGDTFTESGQVYNQGTTALTGIVAKLVVPANDCLTSLALTTSATAPGITGFAASPPTFTCGTRLVTLTFAGSLAPAGAIRVAIKAVTQNGPGTPGCDPAAPVAATCTTAEPQSAGWLFAVARIDQSGDPDSDFCAAGDPRLCPVGVHDKRRNPDEVDPVGHNVSSALGTITAFDLEGYLAAVPAPGILHPGDPVTLRAWAGNQTDGQTATQVNPQSTMTVYVPAGTAVTLPPAHALFACKTSTVPGAVVVTCTYKGPLSAALSASALNIGVIIASNWPAGTPWHAVACAAPPAAQAAAERIPAGAGCGLATQASGTPTNNDAEIDLTVS